MNNINYYSQIQDKRCSQCSALNQYDEIINPFEAIIRCRRCGHQKTIWAISTASTTISNDYITFEVETTPSEIF